MHVDGNKGNGVDNSGDLIDDGERSKQSNNVDDSKDTVVDNIVHDSDDGGDKPLTHFSQGVDC
eukprot:1192736-Ditylum_brightwellii.AAC.1